MLLIHFDFERTMFSTIVLLLHHVKHVELLILSTTLSAVYIMIVLLGALESKLLVVITKLLHRLSIAIPLIDIMPIANQLALGLDGVPNA